MKYLKYFENTEIKQQPFFLNGDRLFISDDFAKSITPTISVLKKRYSKHGNFNSFAEDENQKNKDFYLNTKDEKGYTISRDIKTYLTVRYTEEHYQMTILIYRGSIKNNEFGIFQYYIGGYSGDYSMHGKDMIRATRDCNLNFMSKFYPIVKHIKNFYKLLRLKDKSFFDIIKEAINKDITLAQYGIPKEIKHHFDENTEDAVVNSFKYNL